MTKITLTYPAADDWRRWALFCENIVKAYHPTAKIFHVQVSDKTARPSWGVEGKSQFLNSIIEILFAVLRALHRHSIQTKKIA